MRAGRAWPRAPALFLVDDREQYLANRTETHLRRLPDEPMTIGEAIRGAVTARPAGRVLVTHLGVGLADVVFADAVLRVAEARRHRHHPGAVAGGLGEPGTAVRPEPYSLMGISPSGSSSTMSSPSTTHRVGRQGQVGRRVERLAVAQVEAGEVQRAGDRAVGQEALVELEVLVRAGALQRVQAILVDEEDVGARRPAP